MSVRAYRVNKVVREETPTFNLWHDTKFLDFIERESVSDFGLNENSRQIEVPVETLKTALKQAEALKLDEDHIEQIKADIKYAEKVGDNWLLYDCF